MSDVLSEAVDMGFACAISQDGEAFAHIEDLLRFCEDADLNIYCPQCGNDEGIGGRTIQCDTCKGNFMNVAIEWMTNNSQMLLRCSW